MIPVVTTGTSFRGCVAYMAHDKRREGAAGTPTSERVAWTETRNLPTDDVDRAWRIMAFTATHQKELKAAAGERLTGQRCRKPVYSLTLAWSPSQKPSKQEMLRAVDEALKTLHMEGRQAVVFCHTDEPQPHVHAVVNRICHLTGRAADIKRDWIKLSKWAERYERETGHILCELRVNHNARRAAGEYVKNDNLTRREYEIVRLYMEKSPEQIRTERSLQQTADRLQLQSRLAYRRQLFEVKLAELYGTARDTVARQISTLQGQRDLKGLFAAIVRFKRRLTGETARQERRIADLKKTLANLDMRISEQRATFERQHSTETTKLTHRHRVERERDERLIAHARSRSERERMGLKARLNFKIRGDHAQTYVPREEHREILSRDLTEAGTDKPQRKWSRREGRGAHRTVGRARPQDRRRERD
ncbi:MAG TPA: relaxase/mobilization nuclease domain-containing protein [Hyphomicrobium sp.]|nr:relaxase/mobilization nuclease domain-containing protein [Hyphomicrobium sp.]